MDPQRKRQAVGEAFLTIREQYLAEKGLDAEQWLLGQGTLYPDIIESGGTHNAEVIKSHHNRVARISELLATGRVVEPLAELYKDEVRTLGKVLALPDEIIWRHPFPGPGLSINVLCDSGAAVPPGLETLRETLRETLAGAVAGPFAASALACQSVGVQGDSRTYTPPAVLSGAPAAMDWEVLEASSIHITNTVRGINRVVALLTPETLPDLKPREAYCTAERLALLREADWLATRALSDAGLMEQIFQLLVILLPLSATGKGDCLVLRPVVSEDVMTARFAPLPWETVWPLARELAALPGIEAVFYDITHKPPATFGWE